MSGGRQGCSKAGQITHPLGGRSQRLGTGEQGRQGGKAGGQGQAPEPCSVFEGFSKVRGFGLFAQALMVSWRQYYTRVSAKTTTGASFMKS